MNEKTKQPKQKTIDISEIKITPEHRQRLLALVASKGQLKIDQEIYKDDVDSVAAALGCKAGDVNEMVTIIIQEQEKGGVILAKEKKLEMARQILDGISEDKNGKE